MRLILFFMLLFSALHVSSCDTEQLELYQDLEYSDGICVKEFHVTYIALGKNPWTEDMTGDFRRIFRTVNDLPKSCVEFSFLGKEYYISLANDCNVPSLSEGDDIVIKVIFYETLKQPYSSNPYALVLSVKEMASK